MNARYPTIMTLLRFAGWSLAALRRTVFGIGGVALLVIVGLLVAAAIVPPARWYLVGIATLLLLLVLGLLALSYGRLILLRFVAQQTAGMSDTRKTETTLNLDKIATDRQFDLVLPKPQVTRVHHFLSKAGVTSPGDVLAAYRSAGTRFLNAIDGGAGSGAYSRQFLTHIEHPGIVFAFEPFPGNWRFFDGLDERIALIKKALYSEQAGRKFFVASTVSEDSAWGKRGFVGYSSVGKVVEDLADRDGAMIYDVECVAADAEIPHDRHISFIKLDLQGGELNALKGMDRILRQTYFL